MPLNEYGYKETEVSGTDFIIKQTMAGTRESSAGRRLACLDAVREVRVEYDGVITVSVTGESHWDIGNVVPDDFHLVGGMVHPSNHGKASAHIDIERE
jgi:hypothetical protein